MRCNSARIRSTPTRRCPGLLAPPLLGGETDLYGGAAVLFESNDLSALSGLAIPSDEATYLRLKGAVFVASAGIDTFSPDGDQYAEVLSGASYRITGVTVSSVPEPSSAILILTGGLTVYGFARLRIAIK